MIKLFKRLVAAIQAKFRNKYIATFTVYTDHCERSDGA